MFNRCLASLNLPAALEDVRGVGIPQSLLEKSNGVRMNGGVQKLEKMIKELPELLKRNEEIINEVYFNHNTLKKNLYLLYNIYSSLNEC